MMDKFNFLLIGNIKPIKADAVFQYSIVLVFVVCYKAKLLFKVDCSKKIFL